jgi:tRNA (mo5U34)-methyltransferase
LPTDTSDAAWRDLKQKVAALEGEFHSPIDFGNGLVTKPWHTQRRFNRRKELMKLPADLTGKTVLDIGAWDGYFSFEFEKRGAARVLAMDAWNGRGLECFLLARDHFKSKVEYLRQDARDIDAAKMGTFDFVFCAGLLYHLRHPLYVLEKIRGVTKGQLLLETSSYIPAVHERTPVITFFPGDDYDTHGRHEGGFPTESWLLDALSMVGFKRTEVVYRPSFKWVKKLQALATNRPQRGRLIVHAFVE